jgi:hypothetical protein
MLQSVLSLLMCCIVLCAAQAPWARGGDNEQGSPARLQQPVSGMTSSCSDDNLPRQPAVQLFLGCCFFASDEVGA